MIIGGNPAFINCKLISILPIRPFPSTKGYGFNYVNTAATAGSQVRWGFGWNNAADELSNDVSGGIGMGRVAFSAGDYIGCCATQTGMNRAARVEIYLRESAPSWSLVLRDVVANLCACPNGAATVASGSGAQGTLCEVSGSVDCALCNVGYWLSAPAGVGLQDCSVACSSKFPASTTVATCSACSSEACTAGRCQSGYRNFTAGNPPSCLPNVCSCPFGTATVATGVGATLCEAHGAVDCSNCTSVGYVLNATAGPGQQTCVGTYAYDML